MDFGYPQNLSPEILKLYITQEGVRSPFSSKVRYQSLHYFLIAILVILVARSISLPELAEIVIYSHPCCVIFMQTQPSDKPVPNATLQVTGAVGWRREGLMYKKNEVILSDLYAPISL